MEANPGEAIKNNVLGTRMLAELARQSTASRPSCMISTDKAVHPTSVMGATKRVAEIVRPGPRRSATTTRFVAVRFGNVLGSAGAVIPIFREQIARGGPVTVTHPEMRRYFMTIPEAAQLVLQAGAMGEGGEIFILDMGEPVQIVDLASDMITLSGLRPDEDIEIVFTGLRPGEKLFEELELSGEQIAKTRHPKIFIGRLNAYPPEEIDRALRVLEDLARDGDGTACASSSTRSCRRRTSASAGRPARSRAQDGTGSGGEADAALRLSLDARRGARSRDPRFRAQSRAKRSRRATARSGREVSPPVSRR